MLSNCCAQLDLTPPPKEIVKPAFSRIVVSPRAKIATRKDEQTLRTMSELVLIAAALLSLAFV